MQIERGVITIAVCVLIVACGEKPAPPTAGRVSDVSIPPPPEPKPDTTPTPAPDATPKAAPDATSTPAPAANPAVAPQPPSLDDASPEQLAAALAEATTKCAEDDATSCLAAAAFHHKGVGVPVDLAKADGLYRKACDLKAANGCFMAGGFAKDGTAGAADELDAIAYLGKGCALDDAGSCSALGLVLGGEAGDQRQGPMRQAFEKACTLGLGNGCFMAGVIQDEGKGVPRDGTAALSWYDLGCKAGDGPSCANAGGSLLGGARAGGPPDGPRAVSYLERACTLKAANGCGMLGMVYAQGKLVPKDMKRAETYIRQACTLGFQPACSMLNR